MGVSKFLLFHDLDEILIPQSSELTAYSDLVYFLWKVKPKASGFAASTGYFASETTGFPAMTEFSKANHVSARFTKVNKI